MTNARHAAVLARVDPGPGYGKVYHCPTETTLLPIQDGALVTNLGATADVPINLPPAVVGMEFVFQGLSPFAMILVTSGLDRIGLGPPGGRYSLFGRRSTVLGCSETGIWEIIIGGSTPLLFDITEFGASPDATGATNSAAIQAAHVAASEANPVGIVTGPCGDFPVATSVELLAHMVGPGGNGYSDSVGRLRFMPEMTDGSPCFYGVTTTGLQLEGFAIEPVLSGPANPNPSGGNVQQCIGLQLGKGCSILTGATKANPCVITTKWYHLLEDGDRIVIENMVGMTEIDFNFNGGVSYYVTVVTPTSFKISATLGGAFVNASGFGAAGTKGLVRPYDLGVSTKCSRGVIRDITISGCAVNASIEGWMFNELSMKLLNGTVGFMGHYVNASAVNLILENNWQGHQLLGCTSSFFPNLKDEGGTGNDLGEPSTIDYCEHLHFGMYSGEGERQASGGSWLSIGLVSACRDIHLPHGFLHAGGAAGVSVALGNINGYSLPERTVGGYSTTGSTKGYKGTASFSAGTTIAVTIPTQVDTNYQVLLTPQADPVGRIYVTSKTTSGFTITNTNSTSIAVDWQLVRN